MKKSSVSTGTLLGRHNVGKPSKSGGSALDLHHRIANDKQGPLALRKHLSTKPTSSSGDLGSKAVPLQTNRGGKEARSSDNPLINRHKSTKPRG
jgi:hypothetical protein